MKDDEHDAAHSREAADLLAGPWVAVDEEVLARKFERLLPHLDERQRRLWMAVEADSLGRGGLPAVCRAANVSAPTVRKGLRELGEGIEVTGRVRRPGGGRKRATATDPGLLAALDRLVDPDTGGDPEPRCAGRAT